MNKPTTVVRYQDAIHSSFSRQHCVLCMPSRKLGPSNKNTGLPRHTVCLQPGIKSEFMG